MMTQQVNSPVYTDVNRRFSYVYTDFQRSPYEVFWLNSSLGM